jgi:hypothetical protein
MSPIFAIGTLVVGFLLFYVCYVIHRRQMKKTKEEAFIDDESYIESIEHLSGRVGFVTWQQYDILLATQKYGWNTMVDLAAYLETADIDSIESLTVADMPDVNSVELAHVYNQSKVGLKNFDKLSEEKGVLSIAGHSRALKDSVKIVWFNQTRGLRLFTPINDETLVRRYIETVIRRTFGTNDAMKLARTTLQTKKSP